MKNFIVGFVLGLGLSATIAGAYTWDFDKSVQENNNRQREEWDRQEQLRLQRQNNDILERQEFENRLQRPC